MSRRPKISGYATGKLLGKGAFADVYLVVNQHTGARLACKCIPKSSAVGKRLWCEVTALKSLSHPHIVNLSAVMDSDRYYYILMELCSGGTLAEHIASSHHLDEETAKTVFLQIMQALAFCHEKCVAHRDLKPSNVLITSFPDVKITDFGLSNFLGDGMLSTVCGTIAFQAPEVFQGNYNGCAADVWSAGVLLYTMLVGKIPWTGTGQAQLLEEMGAGAPRVEHVSDACDDLLKAMINPDPRKRVTAADVLKHPWFRGGRTITTPPPATPEPTVIVEADTRRGSTTQVDARRGPLTPSQKSKVQTRTTSPKLKLSFSLSPE